MDRVITMRSERDKLIFRPDGLSEFYDLQRDPLERDRKSTRLNSSHYS